MLQSRTNCVGRGPTPSSRRATGFLVPLFVVMLAWAAASAHAAVGGGFTNGGITGQYYNNTTWSGSPSFTRQDVRINFNWGTTLPPGGSNQIGYSALGTTNWTATWSGQVIPRFSETYTFKTMTAGGVTLSIRPHGNGSWTTLVNDATIHSLTTDSGTFALTAGSTYDLQMQYEQTTGSAEAILHWLSPSTPEETIDALGNQAQNLDTYRSLIFADRMKLARNQWEDTAFGGTIEAMDSNGWPTEDANCMIWEGVNDNDGTYDIVFKGEAQVALLGFSGTFYVGSTNEGSGLPKGAGYNSSTNTTSATLVVTDTGLENAIFSFSNSQRTSTSATNTGITGLKVMAPTSEGATTSYDPSVLFRPATETAFTPFTAFRWLGANFNIETNWSDRTTPTYATSYQNAMGTNGAEDIPWEFLVRFANESGKDLWITIPEQATGATGSDTTSYVYQLAQLIMNGGTDSNGTFWPGLNPNLRLYFEYSNEVWNYGFPAWGENYNAAQNDITTDDTNGQMITFDGVTDANICWNRRQALRGKQASDIFRAVWGNANMPGTSTEPRVRPCMETQYDDAGWPPVTETQLEFIDNYFNNETGNWVTTPHPLSYFFWAEGGATYYDAANDMGNLTTIAFTNPSFESGTTGWTFTGNSGVVANGSSKGNPNAPDGTNAAYIGDTGTISQSVNFTTTGTFAINFQMAGGTTADPINIYVDGTLITPGRGDGNYLANNGGPITNGNSYSQYGSYEFTLTSTGAHTIEFAGTGATGSYAFIDLVEVGSLDGLFGSDIPASSTNSLPTVSQADYILRTDTEANWAKRYGLRETSYEGGWGLGGDAGGYPLQNDAKYSDSRAKTAQITDDNLLNESGVDMQFYGTYATWFPSLAGMVTPANSPLYQGVQSSASALAAEANNGTAEPNTSLTESNKTLSLNDTTGTVSAFGWIDWNIIVSATGAYVVTAATGTGGTTAVSVDDATVLTSQASGGSCGGTVTLTKGLHTIQVRATHGSFAVTSVTVTPGGSSVPAAPTGLTATGGNSTVGLAWNASTGATSYSLYRGTSSGGEAGAPIAVNIPATSTADNSVTNGVTYYYKVAAVDSAGTSGQSNEASATPNPLAIPPAPTGLSATPSSSSVSLNWNVSSGATSYDVYRGTSAGGEGTTPLAVNVGANNYTNTGLTFGVTYYYKVSAVNSAGTSGTSNEVSTTLVYGIISKTATPPTIDGHVDSIWSSTPTYSIAVLYNGPIPSGQTFSGTWQAMWDSTNLYLLCQITNNETLVSNSTNPYQGDAAEVYIDSTDSKTTSYGATDFQYEFGYGLSAAQETKHSPSSLTGVVYAYSAVSGGWVSEVSLPWSTLGATPIANNPVGFDVDITDGYNTGSTKLFWNDADNTDWEDPASFGTGVLEASGGSAPSAPTGLSATAGNGQVALTWNASSGATSYGVYRGTTSGGENATPIATGIATTSYTNTGLTDGVTYYFKVAAVNAYGTSGQSNEASATPQVSAPPAPTGLSATPGNAQVSLSWAASTGATSYSVYRGTTSGGESGTAIASGVTVVSYTDTGLTNGTTYYYTVKAVNAGGTSGASNEASATPTASTGILLCSEPFGEATGALNGANGGTGWSDAWQEQNGHTTVPGYNIVNTTPLTYTGLSTSGNYAVGGYDYEMSGRNPDVSTGGNFGSNGYVSGGLIGATGKTLWISLLLREDTSSADSLFVSTGAQGTAWNPAPALVSVGYFGTASQSGGTEYWSLEIGSTVYRTTVPVTVGTPALFVVEITFGTTSTVNLYLNPTSLGGNAPPTPTLSESTSTNLAFQSFSWYGGSGPGLSSIDQIDFGTTYGSVTPTTSSAPPTPTGLTATPGNAQVALSWNASTGATSYNVLRSTVSGSGYAQVVNVGTTTYTNTGLTNGTTYYFVVAAVNAGGTSANSSQASATPAGPPAAPTGLTATPGNAQVVLSWSASTGATSYNVLRSTTSGSGYAQVINVATTSYTNTGLTNGTTYYFVVAAVNAGGTSANSSQASATPVAPPAAPSGLTATPGNAQVALSWSSSTGATGYNVLRSTTSGSGYAQVTGVGTTSYTNTGLTNGTTYYFVVAAVNAGGTSANSSQASAVPVAAPAAPTGLTATPGSAQVGLAWSASSGATSYNVYRGTTSGGESGTPIATGITATTYTNTGLTNGTTYYYKVTAVNTGGTSGYSSEVSCIPQPSGVLLAQEEFTESTGVLNGAGAAGNGWAGAWSVQNNDTTVPGYNIVNTSPLTYTGLATAGNYAVGGNAYLSSGRSLDVTSTGTFNSNGYVSSGLIGASGKTLWFSVLLRKDAATEDENAFVMQATNNPWFTNTPLVSAGYFGSPSDSGGTRYWSLELGTTVYRTTAPVTVGTPALLVMSIAFGSTNTINLYVNPTSLGGSAPSPTLTETTTTSVAFQSMSYSAGSGPGASSADEIRFGTTYGIVTP